MRKGQKTATTNSWIGDLSKRIGMSEETIAGIYVQMCNRRVQGAKQRTEEFFDLYLEGRGGTQ